MAHLVVPIRVDALVLERDTPLCGPTADFSQLTYWWRNGALDDALGRLQDVNSGAPFLSDAVLTRPFETGGFIAGAGVHLHWALPDILTRTRAGLASDAQKPVQLPAAPNRWLVSRATNGQRAQSVVESDYCHPESAAGLSPFEQPNAITWPAFGRGAHSTDGEALSASGFAPFRFVGRTSPAHAWVETDADSSSPDHLTGVSGSKLNALGWGDPLFAAFYPNCHSVFGFHDAAGLDGAEVEYDIVGWHADPRDDILCAGSPFLSDALAATRTKYLDAAGKDANGRCWDDALLWRTALQERFGWNVGDGQPVTKTFYCARIRVRGGAVVPRASDHDYAIGCSGMEALSAWLAQIQPGAGDDPTRIPPRPVGVGDGMNTVDAMAANEDFLEAIQLDERLSALTSDVGFKFREARHARGFSSFASGTVHTVRPKAGASVAGAGSGGSIAALPSEVAIRLDALNTRQSALDAAVADLAALRHRLHADWCILQRCRYPTPEDATSYPSADAVSRLLVEPGVAAIGESVAAVAATADMTASRDAARAALETILPPDHEVSAHGSRRFHAPADPVVLIAGDLVRPSSRHGTNGLAACTVVDLTPEGAGLAAIRESAIAAVPLQTAGSPWHPLQFEWSVELQGRVDGSNLRSSMPTYDPDFVRAGYALGDGPLDGSDLRDAPNAVATYASSTGFSGKSLFSPHAAVSLSRNIAAWLLKHASAASLPDRDTIAAWASQSALTVAPGDDFVPRQATAARRAASDGLRGAAPLRAVQLEWIVGLAWDGDDRGLLPAAAEDAVHAAHFVTMKALLVYLARGAPGLQTQALTGFHEALLARQQVFQLPIADPLGFPDQKKLANDVASAVSGRSLSAPMPLGDFLPVRSGRFRINRLSLVGSFGQRVDLIKPRNADQQRTYLSEPFRSAGADNGWARLSPRFCQPARLDFRWLSAADDSIEMNTHPATTPICGWLVPNLLDQSIQVHDSDGRLHGIVAPRAGKAAWQPAPASDAAIDAPGHIPDPTLRAVVQWIVSGPDGAADGDLAPDLLAALASALESVNPVGRKAHKGTSLLLGQPLALVRASLGVSLMGRPAVNHTWRGVWRDLATRQTADGASRATDRHEHVRTPVRVGEWRQLDDGLVGYWRIKDGTLAGPMVASQATEAPAGPGRGAILTHADGVKTIDIAPADEAVTLAMLIDPRGSVHATCGMLPTMALKLPAEHYAPALRSLQAFFRVTPVLSPMHKLSVIVPQERGSAWSWLMMQPSGWVNAGQPAAPDLTARFADYNQLADGWLRLDPLPANASPGDKQP